LDGWLQDPTRAGEFGQRGFGQGILRAAADQDHRFARGLERLDRARQFARIRSRTADRVDTLGEELGRAVEGFGLHVLRQAQHRRAAFGRIEQHAQGGGGGDQNLLGPQDPVPVPRHRPERIVGRDRGIAEILDLLEHRIGAPVGEQIAG
jgi:hypothetical protein